VHTTDTADIDAGGQPRYAVVLFDLDNTLSDFDSAQRAALPGLLAEHGVADGASHLPTFKRLADPLWAQLEAGDLTLDTLNDQRFRLLVDHLGLDLDPSLLAPQYLDWLGRSGELWPGAIELLDLLDGEVGMGLVTNGYAEVQRPRLERFGLVGYFSSVTVSSEIGLAKPSQAFFDVALAAHGNPDPSTVLVVGDSLSSDIAGGAAAGCATCWFNPAGREAPVSARIDHVASSLADIGPIVLGL
jgi:2-haloacid dehalogenase